MRRRLALALALASLAGAVALPAGAFHEASNTGTTADYNISDFPGSPGATCRFEDNGGAQHDELDRVRIPDFYAHGPFGEDSTIGYRFLVKGNTPPHSDDEFNTVFRSGIVKLQGDETVPAHFGARTWFAPEGTRSRYRVHILLYWYAQGSQTAIIGRAKGLIEVYGHALGAGPAVYELGAEGDAGYCRRNYHGI